MVPECTFILRNGQKCRCAAIRNQEFCRHHTAQPAASGPSPAPAVLRPYIPSGPSIFPPDLRAAIHVAGHRPSRQAFDDVLVAFAKYGWVSRDELPRTLRARLANESLGSPKGRGRVEGGVTPS